ncbi:MAG: aldehyde dehydrogenase [Oligoflexia bacterium]|nr:aldehyde dehydrogenase [Oligoflexia bacterium]
MIKSKVFINGFGRIGRCVARLMQGHPALDVVGINDIVQDIHNFKYLYNYDSTYGIAEKKAEVKDNFLIIDGKSIGFYSASSLYDIPFDKLGVDILIESSGRSESLAICNDLVEQKRIKKVVSTNSPKSGVDKIIIMGVNESCYDHSCDHVIGSSICDANAIAHLVKCIGENLGIKRGMVTTLHPWLSYQNLVDGPIRYRLNPENTTVDYSLGRSCVASLIPKNTTAIDAVLQVLPEYTGKLEAMSFRIPTNIVTCADLTFELNTKCSLATVKEILGALAKENRFLELGQEHLISIDYLKTTKSCIIDDQWTRVIDDSMVKIILWYDNEWGYSARVVDLMEHISVHLRSRV